MCKFTEKANLVHGEYDYSLVDYSNNKTKVKIICKEHGVFEQLPNNHLKGSGCPKCGGNKKLTTEIFIEKANLVHGEYDYSLVKYVNSASKVKIICKEHGIFEQEANSHLMGSKCHRCHKLKKIGRFKYTTESYIEKVKLIHGDKYDYSLSIYKGSNNKLKIICKEHGVFEQQACTHLNNHGCPTCKESKGEKNIRLYLLNKGILFVSQKKFSICYNERVLPFDFFLPDYNTCIEFDGIQHFEPVNVFGGLNGYNKTIVNDKIKNAFCEKEGIKLIRISYNEDINEKLDKWLIK